MKTVLNKEKSKLLSIGQAVARLKPAYPDLSISKVRFLEDEGLLKPARTKGGYRLFSEDDIVRLGEILRLQHDEFLPLAVIKERMNDWRPGDNSNSRTVSADRFSGTTSKESESVTLDELFDKCAIGMETVRAMESFGFIKVINVDGDPGIGPEDTEIMTVFAELAKFGIEARHLRMYENLAQKESLLFQQILTPQIKHKSQKLRLKSVSDLNELLSLTEKIRSAMLEKTLKEASLR